MSCLKTTAPLQAVSKNRSICLPRGLGLTANGIGICPHRWPRRGANPVRWGIKKGLAISRKSLFRNQNFGGQYKFRTCDPCSVNEGIDDFNGRLWTSFRSVAIEYRPPISKTVSERFTHFLHTNEISMATKIDTVTAREKLKPNANPYWHRIAKGAHLGYRKLTAASAGSWYIRTTDENTGAYVRRSLGDLSDLPNHQRFDAALKAAQDSLTHLNNGGNNEAITVGQACDRLVNWYRNANREKAAVDAEGRFKRWVHSNKRFADTPLLKLTSGMLEDWRTKLAKTPAMHQNKSVVSEKPRAASSLNREMAVLKTALNLALEDGYATSNHAWSSKLKPIKDATGRRDCYLDIAQRRSLIEHAPPDLATLLRVMSLLPLRPGAVAALTASSFDNRLGVIVVGKDKASGDRRITLPASTAAFFAKLSQDKPPSAPLCARANGTAWNKDSWKYPFKDAVIAANLPRSATAYALRHSTITDLLTGEAKLDTMTVAVLSGTSISMIEKHYGHLLHDRAAKGLASLAL